MSASTYVLLLILFLTWVISGGFITQANVYLSSYKGSTSELNAAYWDTFWAAFITWFLVGLAVVAAILAVLGVTGLFATGAGEAAATEAAGEAIAAEGAETAIAAEGAETAAAEGAAGAAEGEAGAHAPAGGHGSARRAPPREEKKAAEGSQKGSSVSWGGTVFMVVAVFLVLVTGVLSAMAAAKINSSPGRDPSDEKLNKAYQNTIISASLSLGVLGLLIFGTISYYSGRQSVYSQLTR